MKIKKSDPLPTGSIGSAGQCGGTGYLGKGFSAAQNEYEAVQLALKPQRDVASLSVSTSPLTGPGGAQVSGKVYREKYVPITSFSGPDGDTSATPSTPQFWPDPLVPAINDMLASDELTNAFSSGAPANENVVAYVEYYVPPGSPGGFYQGALTVAFEGNSISIPVLLNVWPFSIPSTSRLYNYYAMNHDTICQAHGLTAPCPALEDAYTELFLEHRLSVNPFHSTTPDLDVAGSQFDMSYGGWFDGHARPRWTRLAGATHTQTGPFSWFQSGLFLNDQTHLSAWASHYVTKNWFNRTFDYECDEPNTGHSCVFNGPSSKPSLSEIAPRVHSASCSYPSLGPPCSPAMRTLVTTDIPAASAALGPSNYFSMIDVITPNMNSIQTPQSLAGQRFDVRSDPGYRQYLTTSNKDLWWYQACDVVGCTPNQTDASFRGYPHYSIDVSAVQNRAFQWLTIGYGFRGELYYETVEGLASAWSGYSNFGLNGAGTLVYPGTPAQVGVSSGIPIASLRLKHIRDGMEDFEYLKKLDDIYGEPCGSNAARSVFAQANCALVDYASFLGGTRQSIAQAIVSPASGCPFGPPAGGAICNGCPSVRTPPPPPPPSCLSGQTACVSGCNPWVCVNLLTDASNCGVCGRACGWGYRCSSGACAAICSPGLIYCNPGCFVRCP